MYIHARDVVDEKLQMEKNLITYEDFCLEVLNSGF